MKVYPPRDIRPFVMYCVNGKPRSSLLIESTDSMIPGEQEPKTVTAIQLYDMFSQCYSLEGSNAREKEVETVLLEEFIGRL